MKKRKLLYLLLVLCLASVFVFVGCGKDKPANDNPVETISQEPSSQNMLDKEDTSKETEEESTTKKDSKNKDKETEKTTEANADRPGNTQQKEQQTTKKEAETKNNKPTASANAEEQVTEQAGDVAKHTHSYTSRVTKQPTCTSQGIRTYTCSCGASYTEYIPMTAHNIVAKTIQPATCGNSGVISYDCSICGKHDHSETIPATGAHNWRAVYRTETTSTFVCSCGEEFSSQEAWAQHSAASGDGHGSCTKRQDSKQVYDHDECSVCGQTR